MNDDVVLGLDAGGSRLRVALVSREGSLLARCEAGCASPRLVGDGRAAATLTRALARAWDDAGRLPRPFAAVGAGFAGAGDEAARREVERFLAATVAHRGPLRVEHDLATAHRAAFGDAPGVVVVAGTGSAAFAWDGDWNEVRAGGHGPFADDAGSGFDLGRSALAACLRALDGRGEPTVLVAACRAALGLPGDEALVAYVRLGAPPRVEVAALAPVVLAAARDGDRVARALIERAVVELALAASAVARRAKLARPEVAGQGGLFSDPTFVDAFRAALGEHCTGATFVRPKLPPELGAAWWALRALDPEAARGAFEVLRR